MYSLPYSFFSLITSNSWHRLVPVADQLEREALLGLEVLVRLQAVTRHAEHHGVGCGKGFMLVAEALAFGGAARGAVLRVEVQHHLPALEVGQAHGLPAGGLGLEVRTGWSSATAMIASLHWVLWAPWLDQRIEVQGVGKVQELVTQPADLRAGRQMTVNWH